MQAFIQKISILAIPVLLALTFHECAHAFVANKLGDPTAKNLGRLTLNPIKHLDLVGTLAFLFSGMFGWAKPVPINPMNFKDPRRDMMWVAIAGPITNIFLAVLSAILFRVLTMNSFSLGSNFLGILRPLFLMLHLSIIVNIGLAVFNIIPIPPLDGGRVLVGLLPHRHAASYARIEPYGFMILILLMFSGLVQVLISPIIYTAVNVLRGSF